jgi:hypothetical protein
MPNISQIDDPRCWKKWHNSGAVAGKKTRETLEQLFDRRIAQKLSISIEEVRLNMAQCSCCWTTDFRNRMRRAITEVGGNPDLHIHDPLF